MKRMVIAVLCIILTAGFLFAAGEQEGEDGKLNFAIIPMFVGHPWFVRCELGAQKAADELGIDYVFIGPEKADTAKQLDIFTDQVNKGVDAILLAVSEAEVWEKPVQDAIDKGILVFGFDIGAPNTIWLASGWEPEQSGINIGEGVAKEIGGKGKVAILTGSLGSPFLARRQKAIEETLANYSGIELVGVFPTEDDYEKALGICESLLQANPDLMGFASTVSTGVPAAAKAVDNAGRAGEVAIWGVALGVQNAEYVKDGTIKGGLILDAGQMTYLGVKIAHDYITKDGKLPKVGEDYDWAGVPVTRPDKEVSYVDDVLLTPDNIDDFDF
jgi:ABC-type sugar transport system substrate-binding protein